MERNPDSRGATVRLRIVLCLTAGLFLHSLHSPVNAQVQPNPSKAAGSRTQEGGKLYSVEGVVVQAKDGNALNQARVTLLDFSGRTMGSTMTNDEGMFIFYELPPGSYTLNVNHALTGEHNERVDLTVASMRGMRVLVGETMRLGTTAKGATLPVWAQNIPEDARKEYEAGMTEMKAGEWKKCAERMQAAIAVYPQYAGAFSNLGTAEFRLNHRKAAEDAYASALKIDENLVDANLGLGAIYSADKRYADAEKVLLRARLVRPDEWLVLFELGQLYWRMENLGLAEENLARVKTLHAGYARTYLLLMNVLATQDKLRESLAVMNEYLERFPKDPFVAQVTQKRDQLKAHLEANPPPQAKP